MLVAVRSNIDLVIKPQCFRFLLILVSNVILVTLFQIAPNELSLILTRVFILITSKTYAISLLHSQCYQFIFICVWECMLRPKKEMKEHLCKSNHILVSCLKGKGMEGYMIERKM